MYDSEQLSEHHVLDLFDCGKTELNVWLARSARHAHRNNTTRTFVWCEPGEAHVVGYFSLAGHVVEKQALPPKLGRGSPEASPAVLIARLALDKSLHGRGLGGVLLADALQRAAQAAQRVATRFMIVDALDEEAATFYTRYGLKRIPGDTRLFLKMSDVLASLEAL